MFKVGRGLRGSGKVAGGRQGQAAGEGCKVQKAGALWGLDLEPGRNGRWDWLWRPIAAGNREGNSLSHSVPCTGRARHLPKLCHLVFVAPRQLREVREATKFVQP